MSSQQTEAVAALPAKWRAASAAIEMSRATPATLARSEQYRSCADQLEAALAASPPEDAPAVDGGDAVERITEAVAERLYGPKPGPGSNSLTRAMQTPAIREAVAAALAAAPAPAVEREAVAWRVVQIGNTGAAYDPPNTRRAFTYDWQPGNVDAGKLGRAANAAASASAGDSIDRGLALLMTLQAEGFGVFQIDATTPPAEAREPVGDDSPLMPVLRHLASDNPIIGQHFDYYEWCVRRGEPVNLHTILAYMIAALDKDLSRVWKALHESLVNVPFYAAQPQATPREHPAAQTAGDGAREAVGRVIGPASSMSLHARLDNPLLGGTTLYAAAQGDAGTVREDETLWALHIEGPDDVHPAPSREMAQEAADRFNAWEASTPKGEYTPRMRAVVIEWPHGAPSHALEAPSFAANFLTHPQGEHKGSASNGRSE